jgi:hypothetical protein
MTIDQKWWAGLDTEWKKALQKSFEFTEPTPETFEKIAQATHLYLAKSGITSFAPITALAHVTNVDFSGCSALTSFAGLPPSVKVVTFHWLVFDDLSWIDALPNLETGYGDKALQRKVKLRITKNRKARGA